jgi:hypothetical protein
MNCLFIILAVVKTKSSKNLRIGCDKSVHIFPVHGKSTQLVSPKMKRRTQFSTDSSLEAVEPSVFCNF